MHVLIIGAGGMIGRKLAQRIADTGGIGGKAVQKLTLFDLVPTAAPAGFTGGAQTTSADLSMPAVAQQLVADRPDVIFHLAAIVSGEAEKDFDKGYRINLGGTQNLLDAIHAQHPYCPRFVFTSSIAVFGTPLPEVITDEFHPTPLTSYGTQKAVSELLLNDYSRRGFLDALALRLPTICIRPGVPNLAASSFFSGILREPLNGQEAVLPVSPELRHWFASPRRAVDFLLQAAVLDTQRLGSWRVLNMPGLSATVGEQIEALKRVAGTAATALIRLQPDAEIAKIVQSWPQDFRAERALALGFRGESSFDAIIQTYLDDEFDGQLPVQNTAQSTSPKT